MSNTLSCTDTINRTGYTTIDGIKVVQYTCVIPSDKPLDMRVGMVKLNAEMYKANREVCRADYAAFEDAAYKLQDEYIASMSEGGEEA